MEDTDDYEPDPTTGHLDLKYRGWTYLQPTIFSFAYTLLSLDISFNALDRLETLATTTLHQTTTTTPDDDNNIVLPSSEPSDELLQQQQQQQPHQQQLNQQQPVVYDLSQLHLLQELNCSCNQLHSLPESIGSLSYLRILKANGNQLTSLPSSIGNCKSLEQLILSENQLTSLPQDIFVGCTNLRSLLLQNNDLSRLPSSLASLRSKLIELDVSNNNPQLEVTLPAPIHRDVNSIMWILGLMQEKRHVIDRLKQDVQVLQHEIVGVEEELAESKRRIEVLEERGRCLKKEMESVEYFLIGRMYVRRFRRWMLRIWEEGKRAFARRLQR